MMKRIKSKIERARLVDKLTKKIAQCIGDFLGMSEHEEAVKHGLRMMSEDQMDELRSACDRVKEWIKDVQIERLGK